MSAREQRTPAIGSCKPRVVTAELSPAQWMALRFFARNSVFRSCRSAEFQAKSRGTASQAIKALKTSEYLARQ